MSTVIENGVVKMSFDNANFERNAKTTMGTLDRLKGMLNFSKTAKSFDEISRGAKNVNLAPLQNGIQEVHNRFNVLDAVTFTVFSNITNRAVNAGMRITEALTIKGALDGFREYELNMNSVQTLMNGTGESLQRVNQKLHELNEYSDQTIYSFSDMTSNITKFTNQGISLDDSVAALKGISNWAAYAGVGTQQAAMAMYNLGQALGRGHVMAQDWLSIRNAAMDTQDFKERCVEAALAIGTLDEATVKSVGIQGLFADELGKKGWLTNEVLLSTLKEYSDATTEIGKKATAAATQIKTFSQLKDTVVEAIGTGWADTWNIVIGDLDQAKALWTPIGNYISDVIGGISDSRNELLKGWAKWGGRDDALKGLVNIFRTLEEAVKAVHEAFGDVFPKATVGQLVELSRSFASVTQEIRYRLFPSMSDLHKTFRGLFSIVDIGVQAVSALGRAFVYLVQESGVGSFLASLLGLTGALGDYAYSADQAIKENDTFYSILKRIVDFFLIIPKGANAAFEALTGMSFVQGIDAITRKLTTFKDVVGGLIGWLDDLGRTILNSFSGNVNAGLDSAGNALDGASEKAGIVTQIFTGLATVLGTVADKIINMMKLIGEGIKEVFSGVDNTTTFDFLNTSMLAGGLSAAIIQIKHLMDPLNDLGDFVQDFREDMQVIFKGLQGYLTALQTQIKADVIMKIAKAVALLAVSCVALAAVDAGKLGAPLAVIGSMMAGLMVAMNVMNKLSPAANTFGGAIKGLMSSLGMMAQATALSTVATAILKLAAALWIVAQALKTISDIEPAKLAAATAALAVALGAMVAAIVAINKFTNPKGLVRAGAAMLLIADALLVVSVALKIMGTMNMDQLSVALTAIVGSLWAMTLALVALSKFGGSSTKLMASGTALLLIADALMVVSLALKVMGSMSPDQLAVSMIALAGSVVLITGALTVLSKAANPVSLLAAATAFTIVSTAISILSVSLRVLATMSGDQAMMSLATMSISLIAIGAALAFLSTINAVKLMAASSAILVVSAALAVLTPSLIALSIVPAGALVKALVAVAAAIAIFAIAAVAVTPAIAPMYALAGALALLGLSIAAIGGGVFLLATGMALLAVSGTAGAIAMTSMISVLVGAVPMLMNGVGVALRMLLQLIPTLVEDMVNAGGAMIEAFCQAIITRAPIVGETFITLINTGLTVIQQTFPQIVETGFLILMTLLSGIRDNIGPIVTVVSEIIYNFLTALGENMGLIIQGAFNLIIGFIDGLGQAIEDNAVRLRTAIFGLCEHIIKAILKFFGFSDKSANKMVKIGKDIVGGITGGIRDKIETAVSVAGKVASGIKSAFKGMKEKMHDIGGNLMKGLKNGMEWFKNDVLGTAADIGGKVLNKFKKIFDIHSPSKETTEMGKFLDLGLAGGMVQYLGNVLSAVKKVGNTAMTSLRSTLTNPKSFAGISDFTPTIKPVLDLSNIQNGARNISRILNGSKISANANITGSEINRARSSSGAVSQQPNVNNNVTNITYNQTNNSPKALDRYEIYRQTRNQLNLIKGARI